ncbi:hypothetical protein BDA96_08G103100 [Sorghum bicolor]|uniref:Uncharacterized protein n=1 Tax=Sorghum bicolor TaxID=4558 RepID=A0A921QEZ1_SORBI|nr:hypothetical protein BDA96_08G103100 [Sorghum bicolor]
MPSLRSLPLSVSVTYSAAVPAPPPHASASGHHPSLLLPHMSPPPPPASSPPVAASWRSSPSLRRPSSLPGVQICCSKHNRIRAIAAPSATFL